MKLLVERVSRNISANLFGQGIPLIVALATVPYLFERLGAERFGVLALGWTVVGYLGLLDFGMGRAMTQFLASSADEVKPSNIGGVLATGLASLGVTGALACIAVFPLIPILVSKGLGISAEITVEVQSCFRVLAIALPFVIVTAGCRGALEGFQRFPLANAIRMPFSTLMYLGPTIVVAFDGPTLIYIAFALTGIRIVGFFVYLVAVARVASLRYRDLVITAAMLKRLLSYGGWLTISNVISPLLVYVDRVAIGALLSVSAVAFYVTAHELASRLQFIGLAIGGAIFPAFAANRSRTNATTDILVLSANRSLLLLQLPPIALLVFFAHPLLSIWIGTEVAEKSYLVTQIVLVGVWVNALAQLPFAMIQAFERPDITAKIHMFEAPIYFAVLWLLIQREGIIGAALAWTMRVTIDLFLLTIYARRLSTSRSVGSRQFWITLSMSSLALAALASLGNHLLR